MKCVTTYERLMPDTICGEGIKLTQVYTSFDIREIDELEENLKRLLVAVLYLSARRVAMQIIIDIRKETYERIKEGISYDTGEVRRAIRNGTVLPKHGQNQEWVRNIHDKEICPYCGKER